MRLSLITTIAYAQLLLQLVSTEALPALDPCWRQCVTHQLPCADADWPCFCRTARTTPLLANSVTCIRQTCTAGRPFDPITLLTPFREHCKKPIAPTTYANAEALAAQDRAPSPANTSNVISTNRASDAGGSQAFRVEAPTSIPKNASVVATTYIGGAANSNDQQETHTVPELAGTTGTLYGSPASNVQGTVTSANFVTLPAVSFSAQRSAATSGISSARISGSQGGSSVVAESASPTTAPGTSNTSSQSTGGAGDDGTILSSNDGIQYSAASSLGLMVVLLVAVIWF
ncbi:MAG: hypothetical protein Q9218_004291 [Villophora microphyllina]